MSYTAEVIRSDRRTLGLSVRPDGTILVRAPRRMSMARIRAFVDGHRDWIEARLREQRARGPVQKLSEEELRALKKAAKKRFPERVELLAPQVGATYGRIAVRCQRSRWGSCSKQGNLNFNCLLMLAPPEVLDYVVVHELCHRLEMNHSPRFWGHVERVLPDWRERRRWLKEHERELMARIPE